jgi:hypothetical protein
MTSPSENGIGLMVIHAGLKTDPFIAHYLRIGSSFLAFSPGRVERKGLILSDDQW